MDHIHDLSDHGVLSGVALRAPQWPDHPVLAQVYAGETHYVLVPCGPPSRPPLLREASSFGMFRQGSVFGEGSVASQFLAGYSVERGASSGERAVSVLFSASGRTYELSLRFPVGYEASQPLLTAYSAIVEGFRLDVPPATPTPPPSPTAIPVLDAQVCGE